MSNNCSGKRCDKPEINVTISTQQREGHQQMTTRFRTGTAKIFRAVREHLFPISSDSLKRKLVTTTVTTTFTIKVIKTRTRSTTTILKITTTDSITKVSTADCVRIQPTLYTSTTTKSIVPSSTTKKVTKTTKTKTTTTTTTTTNINPIAKTTTTVKKTVDRGSKFSAHRLCRNRRHAMYFLH